MTARRAGGKKRAPKKRKTAKSAQTQTAPAARRSREAKVRALQQAFESAGIGLVNLVREGDGA
jgi:hypothetical protein